MITNKEIHTLAFGLSKTTQIYTSQEALEFILKKIEEIGQDRFDNLITQFVENQSAHSFSIEYHNKEYKHNNGFKKEYLSFCAGKKDKLVDNFWSYMDYPRVIFLNS